ncbi:MAG: hypothetical protein MI919_18910, partial [Holophagales bacterium]|nr:hypothetical protein [Holophagales bacterium]
HFQRFSPYHFEAESFGLELRAKSVYRHLFPFPEADLENLAYYFEDRRGRELAKGSGRIALEAAVARWRGAWSRQTAASGADGPPRLEMLDDGEDLRLFDSRRCATAPEHRLCGLEAEIYRACDSCRSTRSLCRSLGEAEDPADASRVAAAVERLESQRLLLRLENRVFALAVAARRPSATLVSEADAQPSSKRPDL